jgi:hypothetical protein
MPTVHEILKQTGLSDEQIAALDAKAIAGFNGVLSTAEQERQAAQQAAQKAEQERQAASEAVQKAEQERQAAAAALEAQELRKRSNDQWYEESVVPALNGWGNEKIQKDAELAFYKSQLEGAKQAGFIPSDAPNFVPAAQAANPQYAQPRDAQGRYVPGMPGATPGSPTFSMEAIDERLGNGISNIGWAIQTHQKLTGEFLPDSFDQLSREADAARMPFRDYVARKYDYAGKQREMQLKSQQEHDEKIRADVAKEYEAKIAEKEAAAKKLVEETDRKWAERVGSNPDVRQAAPSKFSEVARAVKAGERPDPLNLSVEQRRQVTRQAIRQDISEEVPA